MALRERILPDFQDKHRKLFDEQTVVMNHKLRETGLFTHEAIGKLIDRCDPEHYNLNTMGFDKNVLEWRSGDIGDLSGADVIEAISRGRMWMNLHRIMDRDPVYADVLSTIFSEFEEQIPQLSTFKHNMTLLISSPNVQVYYHADIQGQSLWQIEGRKRIFLYPPTEAFLSGDNLEKILLREQEEEMPYYPWYEEYANGIDLEPGQMAHWPLYAPHRVENYDCLNISVTTEHWTKEIWKSYAVNFGNGVLRRTLGLQNLSRSPEGLHVYPKAAASLLWKKLKPNKEGKFKNKVDFRADPEAQNGAVDIDPYFKMS